MRLAGGETRQEQMRSAEALVAGRRSSAFSSAIAEVELVQLYRRRPGLKTRPSPITGAATT